MNLPSSSEMFFIFIIVLLLFGAKRIPEIARSFGKAANEFKKAKDEVTDAANSEIKKEEQNQEKKS
jgi:sec-independent protein translocase protein TatA